MATHQLMTRVTGVTGAKFATFSFQTSIYQNGVLTQPSWVDIKPLAYKKITITDKVNKSNTFTPTYIYRYLTLYPAFRMVTLKAGTAGRVKAKCDLASVSFEAMCIRAHSIIT